MGRKDSIVSPFAAGSGRKRDLTFPDFSGQMSGAALAQCRDRTGENALATTLTLGAAGSLNLGVVNGVPCCRMINAGLINQGPVLSVQSMTQVHPALTKGNLFLSGNTDDTMVYRVYMIARVTATPGGVNPDVGLQLLNTINSSDGLLRSNKPGMGIQISTTGNCDLVINGQTSLQAISLQTAAQGYVNTDFNAYEFRILNATTTTDAVLKVLLNGNLKQAISWGAGSNLPIPSQVGPPAGSVISGFLANVNQMAAGLELDVALLRVQSAPTEAALF